MHLASKQAAICAHISKQLSKQQVIHFAVNTLQVTRSYALRVYKQKFAYYNANVNFYSAYMRYHAASNNSMRPY